MSLSIVIPVYGGAATIGPLAERLIDGLGKENLQLVLVNDGSPDNSDEICRALQAKHPKLISYVHLAKNFGEHNAVMAGLHHARGDYVVVMDDDFQNPPEEVPRLVQHAIEQGFDVVYTFSRQKQHHWFRNLGSRLNGIVANLLLDKPRDLYLSSFKCLSRLVVGEVLKYSGPYPYIDGLALRCTRRIGTIEVRHDPRSLGRSGYTLRKLVRLWLNMFVNFSVLPLRVSTVVGFLLSILGFVLGVLVVVERLVRPGTPVGWTSVIVTLLVFSGMQLIMLGLVGEYVGRLFLSINQTPQYVVREVVEENALPCPTNDSVNASTGARS